LGPASGFGSDLTQNFTLFLGSVYFEFGSSQFLLGLYICISICICM